MDTVLMTEMQKQGQEGSRWERGEVGRKVSLIRYMPSSSQQPLASFPVTKLPIPSGGKVVGEGSVHV